MKTNYLKYKIVNQSKENVWGKYNHIKKFKKQKWMKMVKKLDRPRKFYFYRRPRSNRVLSRQRLLTKQTFKHFYGNLSYAKLKKEYHQIPKTTHLHPIQNLIISLERRLDVFLFRSGLFPSILEAKQAIIHKKISVNNQIVSNSNYRMNGGDFIRIPTSILSTTLRNVPYSQINHALNLLVFLRNPNIQEIRYPFQLNLNFLTNYLTTK